MQKELLILKKRSLSPTSERSDAPAFAECWIESPDGAVLDVTRCRSASNVGQLPRFAAELRAHCAAAGGLAKDTIECKFFK